MENLYNKSEIPDELKQYFCPVELGSEKHFKDFVNNLCNVFDEVQRVLKPTGTCFVNLGDTFSSDTKGTRSLEVELLEFMQER